MTAAPGDGELSAAARSVWAKSGADPANPGVIEQRLFLPTHLSDTAAIASRVWDHWTVPAVKAQIIRGVGGSESAAKALLVWAAATHDIGKASPAFAVQVPVLADDMAQLGLWSDKSLAGTEERRSARHELVSHVTAADWLVAEKGFDLARAHRLASILAAHHGKPPSDGDVRRVARDPRLFGDRAWTDVRHELIIWATAQSTTDDDLAVWREAELPQQVLALVSGLLIVSDWIASSSAFPLAPVGTEIAESPEERAERAWNELALPAPWHPAPPRDIDTLFRERFALPDGASPRPMQREAVRIASEITEPQLLVVEAPMGQGKTEAALAAAEVLAHRFGLGGVFIGLPTQATADGMYARAVSWAESLGLDQPLNVFLAHGRRGLNEDYARRSKDAFFRSICPDHDERKRRTDRHTDRELVIAHHWMGDPKRGPLANLVVGTIDQALVGGLRSKHVMLRHLALAGKVVILDEVHAADDFMSQYLRRILHWLGAYRVPVILLSATLPSDSRRELVMAYDAGRRVADGIAPAGRRGRTERTARYSVLDGDIGYPSIVVSGGEAAPEILLPAASTEEVRLQLTRIPDDEESLIDLLRSAFREGGNIAVIRNTVTRVQETAAALRAAFGHENVTVAHSRFLAADRAAKDRGLLVRFGKNGDRPERHIVVASQVIEQSLDIDFDLMVSDLAPIDLLLQRAGRLHRHPGRLRPAPLRTPRLVVTGVEWSTEPPTPDRGSRAVYADSLLLRTLAVLDGRTEIRLAEDIPTLVQAVYGPDDVGPDTWQTPLDDARRKDEAKRVDTEDRAENYLLKEVIRGPEGSLLGWVHGSAGDPDRDSQLGATVRDGEDTLEVIVLERLADDTIRTPHWLPAGGSRQIPTGEVPDPALTRTILGCALRLPAMMCHGKDLAAIIDDLERRYPLPIWHTSHSLKGELVLLLDQNGHGRVAGFDLRYSPEDGLLFSRTPESETR